MGITIKNINVSPDGETLNLEIETTEANFTVLELWTDKTYKDVELIEDISHYLVKTGNTETLAIPVEDINGGVNNIYFLNIQDGSSNTLVAAVDLLVYYNCVMPTVLSITSCTCFKDVKDILYIGLLVNSLRDSMQIGRYEDSITIFNELNLLCL